MAFLNSTGTGITTEATVHTVAAGKTNTVIGMTIAPTSGRDSVVDIKVDGTYLIKGLKVYNGTTAVPIGGEQKLVLVATNQLKVTGSTAVDVIVSYLE
jgi:hypothetical protein